ncbi:MAG TPA: L-seryl-tRNA(Sec) selenium transferase, partial [Burkholderiaceae bacterium]|nr:L-seryl-tRNA(Sec) selenium transferase [Burkholderiaceae bacterium]
RISKLTMAALDATLSLYRHPEQLCMRLPTLRLLTRPQEEIAALAERIAQPLAAAVGRHFVVSHGPVKSEIGSGSLPGEVLPSAGLFIRCTKPGRGSAERLQRLVRVLLDLPVPVIGRVADGALILDLRTLTDEAAFTAQFPTLMAANSGARLSRYDS